MESNKVTPLQFIEVASLNGYLQALQCILNGVNYVTGFEAKAYHVEGPELPIKDVLLMAYPHARLDFSKVERSFSVVLFSEIHKCFSESFAECLGVDRDSTITRNLGYGFLNQMNECIGIEDAVFYKYNSWDGLPDYAVMWYFLWLIHIPERETCIVLYGSASD